tara:strand:+ start:3210 stop:4382 length:1173 start_codon:yes stop_codon:yes gene_type:complete
MTKLKSGKKIKVLHLITSLEVGGAQRGLLLGLPKFNSERYEHIICSMMSRVQMKHQFQEAGIEVTSLGLEKKTDIAVVLRLRSLIRELRPDILHTYLLHSNVIGRIVGRLLGVPIIISSERTIGQANSLGRFATKLTNPLTDVVEVNSHTGSKFINKELGVPLDKIEVVLSGLEVKDYSLSTKRFAIRSSLGITDRQHLVLYVGRLRRVKGLDQGLCSFALALNDHPAAHLAIAGEGEQLKSLEALVTKLNISDNVTFLGIRDDLPDIFSACDSLLMPSRNEGLPRVAIEAMAAGKPVIATDVGGTSEVVNHGETGILVDPGDIEKMGLLLSKLIGNVALQNRLGRAGQKRVIQHYSIENYVSRLDSLYCKLFAACNTHQKLNINQDISR